MSKSTYKKWMTEAFIDEVDDDKEKKKVYQTDKGWAGNYKGDIEYFDDEEKATQWSKTGSTATDGDSADEPKKAEPKQTAISKTGGLGDDEPKGDDKPKGERPATIHLDYDQADDDLDDLRYAGELSDNPGLVNNISDMVKLIQSGHATDDDIQRATDIVDTMDDMDMTNPDAGVDDMSMALQSSIDAHVKGGQSRTGTENIKRINGKKYKPIKEFKHPLKEQYDRLFTNKVIL